MKNLYKMRFSTEQSAEFCQVSAVILIWYLIFLLVLKQENILHTILVDWLYITKKLLQLV